MVTCWQPEEAALSGVLASAELYRRTALSLSRSAVLKSGRVSSQSLTPSPRGRSQAPLRRAHVRVSYYLNHKPITDSGTAILIAMTVSRLSHDVKRDDVTADAEALVLSIRGPLFPMVREPAESRCAERTARVRCGISTPRLTRSHNM